MNKTYLITGAGTGFGKEIAFGLAKLGLKVIAGVETMSEVSMLLKEAEDQQLTLRIEKQDNTNPMDRKHKGEWNVDDLH